MLRGICIIHLSTLSAPCVEQQRDAAHVAALTAADDGEIEAAPEFEISSNQARGSSRGIETEIVGRAAPIVKRQANSGVILGDGEIALPVAAEIRGDYRDRLGIDGKVDRRLE